jgi:hypothetical protein
MSTSNIQDFAAITDGLKREYCERYGYKFFIITEKDFVIKTEPYNHSMDWNKALYIKNVFEQNPDVEWLLLSEADATITNLTIPMEDKIDNDYHVIIPVDRLNLNSGNFLIRNSEQGRAYIQALIDAGPAYAELMGPNSKAEHKWGIQQWMIDTIGEYSDIVKIVPQKYMNSYEPALYDYCDASRDVLGTSGVWEKGDWILHWPGLRNQVRVARANALESEDMLVR